MHRLGFFLTLWLYSTLWHCSQDGWHLTNLSRNTEFPWISIIISCDFWYYWNLKKYYCDKLEYISFQNIPAYSHLIMDKIIKRIVWEMLQMVDRKPSMEHMTSPRSFARTIILMSTGIWYSTLRAISFILIHDNRTAANKRFSGKR